MNFKASIVFCDFINIINTCKGRNSKCHYSFAIIVGDAKIPHINNIHSY